MRASFRSSFLTLALWAPSLLAQSGGLTGTVVSRETGERLAYSIVELPAHDQSQFATDSGVFRFRNVPVGKTVLRIRRLGFTPRDIVVEIRFDVTDTMRVELTRVVLSLEGVSVKAHPPCKTPGVPTADKDSALAAIFEQVRLNAEQYLLLAKQYPFQYRMVVSRSRTWREAISWWEPGGTRTDPNEIQTYFSTPFQYRPGRIVQRRSGDDYFRIPTLAEIADPRFLGAHCWHYGGVESLTDSICSIRVDLVADEKIGSSDVDGSIYIDPRTFQIRRSVLNLTKPTSAMKQLANMEVTTDYKEILESVFVIGHVFSTMSYNEDPKVKISSAKEEQRLLTFGFVKDKPGVNP